MLTIEPHPKLVFLFGFLTEMFAICLLLFQNRFFVIELPRFVRPQDHGQRQGLPEPAGGGLLLCGLLQERQGIQTYRSVHQLRFKSSTAL